jgi:5'-nucleotidase
VSPASDPIQEFFSIGEVCELTGLKPHVLRYWESQFRFLSPAKNRSGNRVYQRREVELINLVKHLLYDEKYTIEGARQKVDEHVQRGERRWQVDGTPTDCVMLAVEALMPERPDFVFSGINHGQNMGEDVLYSGTVAAAMEGLSLGIPSIAISFAGGDLRADVSQLEQQVSVLTPLLERLTSLPNFPANTLFNVNLPPLPASEVKGVKFTRLGRRVYSQSVAPMKDPWGRQIYWIGGGSITWSGEADSDFRAIQDGYISVTPLHLDLTHYDALQGAAKWWENQ